MMFCIKCGAEVLGEHKFCGICGQRIVKLEDIPNNSEYSQNDNYSYYGGNIKYGKNQYIYTASEKYIGVFSVARLVIGIISMVLSVFVLLQSYAVDTLYTLADSEETAGSVGIMFSLLFLAAAIVGVCTRNSKSSLGAHVSTLLYWVAGMSTFGVWEAFEDLLIWGIISIGFGIFFFVAAIKSDNKKI